MAPRVPKRPKKKSNVQKASAVDAFLSIQPYLQDMINYGAGAAATTGAGALGYMGNKARKMMKAGDKAYEESLGKKAGGAVMKARGGTFKGTF
jgi:hypothetical protein